MRLAEQSTGHQLGKREYQRTAVDDDAKRIMMMTGHQKVSTTFRPSYFYVSKFVCLFVFFSFFYLRYTKSCQAICISFCLVTISPVFLFCFLMECLQINVVVYPNLNVQQANAAAFIERVRLSAMIDEPNESRFTMTD